MRYARGQLTAPKPEMIAIAATPSTPSRPIACAALDGLSAVRRSAEMRTGERALEETAERRYIC
jgi:hypothetical protein